MRATRPNAAAAWRERAARLAISVGSSLRGWNGSPAARTHPLPTAPQLTLYEFEASPACRRVRETLGVLGLRVLVLPCPRETLLREGAYSKAARHKPAVREAGGRLLFPFLVDNTAGVALNESADITRHLWQHYGFGVERPAVDRVMNGGLPTLIDFPALAAPSWLRPWPHAGLMMAPSRAAVEPLVLHGCEPEPGSRLVRELLCTLQLPYTSVPRELSHTIPHLEDPNTGWKGFGERHALAYLADRYQLGPPLPLNAPAPNPNLGDTDRKSPLSWLIAPR